MTKTQYALQNFHEYIIYVNFDDNYGDDNNILII